MSPASASIAAGGSQTYTAQGFDAAGNSLGDVTASTTFSIAPTAPAPGTSARRRSRAPTPSPPRTGASEHGVAGRHPAGLDHLVLSPASATIPAGGSQAYSAEGRDRYDNSLGDVTGATTFSIGPDGSCTGVGCTATAAGAHTVTGTDAGKSADGVADGDRGHLDHITISPATRRSRPAIPRPTAPGRDHTATRSATSPAPRPSRSRPNGSCSGNVCTATVAGAHTVTGTDGGTTDTAARRHRGQPRPHHDQPGERDRRAGRRRRSPPGFDAVGNSLRRHRADELLDRPGRLLHRQRLYAPPSPDRTRSPRTTAARPLPPRSR